MCLVGHSVHMGVFLLLVLRNEAFFKNKETLNVRLLLTFPGAGWKGSFCRLPEWFLWFPAALAPFMNNVVICVDTDLGSSGAEQLGGPCPKELRDQGLQCAASQGCDPSSSGAIVRGK